MAGTSALGFFYFFFEGSSGRDSADFRWKGIPNLQGHARECFVTHSLFVEDLRFQEQ